MRSIAIYEKYKTIFGLFVLCLSIISFDVYSSTPLRIKADRSHNQLFIRDALKLAISKLPEAYLWQDVVMERHLTEPRHIKMVIENQLDVFWQTTSVKLENQLQPVRIPIFRGLMGYRLLVIHENAQSMFANIKTINELKSIRFGQGQYWPDTTILRSNGLQVVTAELFLDLYPMLKFNRFDAFPRGLHQVWHELSWINEYTPGKDIETSAQRVKLAVEKRLILKYMSPMYFFVSKNNTALAIAIEKGLRIAIQDGSYQKLFLNNPAIKEAIVKSDFQNRTIIKLENPMLPSETPIEDKSLWFDPILDIPSK